MSSEPYLHPGAEIESLRRTTGNQDNSTWSDHCDIIEVMLVTRLVPDGFPVISGSRINNRIGQQ